MSPWLRNLNRMASGSPGAVHFQLGVDNLFNRKAPYIQSFTDANTDTMTYDLLRRRFYVGVRTAF